MFACRFSPYRLYDLGCIKNRGDKALTNIAIIGAGAIGCRIAAHLAQQGTPCVLVDGWQDHVDALNRSGLTFEHQGRMQTFSTTAYHCDTPPTERFDVVLLAVRSDETQKMLPLVQALLADDGCVVSCQNGLNEEDIAQAVGPQRTLGCSLILGARLMAPGHVLAIEGPDTLRVGEFQGGRTPRLQYFASVLGACGTATATDNLIGYRWMKLVLNATGNTLLLLTGMNGAQLHDQPDARRIIIAMAQEILRTALADGAEPEPVLEIATVNWLAPSASESATLHERLAAHGRMLGPRRLSMVADFEARGRTEVGEINGKVLDKARRLGIATPLNAAVLRMVREMETQQRSASPLVLNELLTLSRTGLQAA